MRVVQTEVEGEKNIVVLVNEEEAVRIIKSLAHQMMMQSSNTGREEFQTEDEEYFTIAIKAAEVQLKEDEVEVQDV